MSSAEMKDEVIPESIQVSSILIPGVLMGWDFDKNLSQERINLVHSVVKGYDTGRLTFMDPNKFQVLQDIRASIYKQYSWLEEVFERHFGNDEELDNSSGVDCLEAMNREIIDNYQVTNFLICRDPS